ncbi:MAG: heme o synthase [Actinobacteria bacterium]|nr:heme o synthase [Actinomycetota bacterium]
MNKNNLSIKKIHSSFKNYLEISKPRSVALLYFTSLVAILIASSIYGYDLKKIILISVAVILGVMGANATTNYIDRKIDAIMERTKKRAIASGRINPAVKGLVFAIVFIIAGIALAAYINWISAIFLFLGFFDSAIIYNGLTKRKSKFNILYGSFAGGFPVLIGWTAISSGKISLLTIIMFLFVIIWTPAHIWSLAYFYKEDYKKANIPMLPVFLNERQNHFLIASLNVLMIIAATFLWYFYKLSLIYLIITSIFGIALITISIIMIVKSSRNFAWILFKLSSPYLGIVFLLLLIEFLWYAKI